MELRLSLFGIKRSIDLSRWARYRNPADAGLSTAGHTADLLSGYGRLPPDLAHGNVAGAQALLSGWAKAR